MTPAVGTQHILEPDRPSQLAEIYAEAPDDLLRRVGEIVGKDAGAITDQFYSDLMGNPDARRFLDHHKVEKRLKPSLKRWLLEVLKPATPEEAVERERQQLQIGDVHARINVPMRLVDQAMRVLKQQCFLRLIESDLDRHGLAQGIILVNGLLDESLSAINESYVDHVVTNERNAQSLRISVTGRHIALECERMRGKLYIWERQLLKDLLLKANPDQTLPDVRHSEFGLWVAHKAGLYFSDLAEMAKLNEQIAEIQAAAAGVLESRSRGEAVLAEAVGHLSDAVNKASWLLSELNEVVLAEQNSTDPLTHLLNRRFLNSVMQRETRISRTTENRFGVLMVDLDDFKPINDLFGHGVGDIVLQELGELLLQTIRVTDFAFRYGGEEFLVLVTSVAEDICLRRAEDLRLRVEEHPFSGPRGEPLRTTVSIGVAIHDGHPDFQRTIEAADRALYAAKQAGKNRCVLADVDENGSTQ